MVGLTNPPKVYVVKTMSQGEEDHEDDHGKPIMLLWEVAEQGIKCYAEKRGKQLRVQEAAARARENQRVLREAAKNALRKGSAGKERSKENTAAKATPQEVQSFSELKLKQIETAKSSFAYGSAIMGSTRWTERKSFWDGGNAMIKMKSPATPLL